MREESTAAPNMWQQPAKTDSTTPLCDQPGQYPSHDYEELPAKPVCENFASDYLTTREVGFDPFPPQSPVPRKPSVCDRKGVNALYGDTLEKNNSANVMTPAASGGNLIKSLVVLVVLISLIAVAALLLAGYSVFLVWRAENSDALLANETVNVEILKEQVKQLQQENLLLPNKVAKLLGFESFPDNSTFVLSDLLANNSQIIAVLSDKVIKLIASSADDYRNLSNQTNNLTAILALLSQQQQQHQSTWSTQLAFVQNNLTARLDALTRLPGPQGPPGPATTVNLTNCTVRSVTIRTSAARRNTKTVSVNFQAEHPDHVVTGVTCTTDIGETALLNSDASTTNEYYCTCTGNTSGSSGNRGCFMYYWLCPRIFRGG